MNYSLTSWINIIFLAQCTLYPSVCADKNFLVYLYAFLLDLYTMYIRHYFSKSTYIPLYTNQCSLIMFTLLQKQGVSTIYLVQKLIYTLCTYNGFNRQFRKFHNRQELKMGIEIIFLAISCREIHKMQNIRKNI